jgi:hypothetical protein
MCIDDFRRTWDPGWLPPQDQSPTDARREIWTAASEERPTDYIQEIPSDAVFQDPFVAFAYDCWIGGRIGVTALAFATTWTVPWLIFGRCLRPANPLLGGYLLHADPFPGGCLRPADLWQALALPPGLLLPPFRENRGSVVDGASHSRFESPISCYDLSTRSYWLKMGSKEDLCSMADETRSNRDSGTNSQIGVICKELYSTNTISFYTGL